MSRACVGTPCPAAGDGGNFASLEAMKAFPSAANVLHVSEQDMSPVRRQRILIGVLDTMTAMRRAIDDLAVANLDQMDTLIVADAGAFFGALENSLAVSGIKEAGPCVLIRRQKSGEPANTLSQDSFFGSEDCSFRTPQIERWIGAGLSRTQEGHLQAGGALLVVWVRTAEQERLFSETMLMHSVDNVQLHDI